MKIRFALLTFLLAVAVTVPGVSWAKSNYQTVFNRKYGTVGTRLSKCNVCHQTASGSGMNSYGTAVRNQLNQGKTIRRSLRSVQRRDSDGDGFTNIREIRARTFPGNANSSPTATATLGVGVQARAKAVNTYSQDEYAFLTFDHVDADHYRYVSVKADQVLIGQTDGYVADDDQDMGSMEVSIPLGAWSTIQVDVLDTSVVKVFVDGGVEPFASYEF